MKWIEINAVVQTLGWVLLHSLWQGMAVYLILLTVRRALLNAAPSLHYAVNIVALSMIPILGIVTFFQLLQQSPGIPVAHEITGFRNVVPAAISISESDFSAWWAATGAWINSHTSEIVGAWIAGIVVFGIRLLIAAWFASNLQRNMVPVKGYWEERLLAMSARMNIRKAISLAESASVNSPLLLGYLKPVILLPIGILSSLSTEQVEAVLLHELAHIRRGDYAVNLIQSCIEVVFFFNPFAWAISSQVRLAREHCCDDTVVRSVNPADYAQALYKLEEVRWHGASLALAAAGTQYQLLQRIKRIMEPKQTKKETGRVMSAMMVLTLILVSGLFVMAYKPVQKNESRGSDGKTILASDTSKDRKAARRAKPDLKLDENQVEEVQDVSVPVAPDPASPLMAVVPDVEFEIPAIDFSVFAPIADIEPIEYSNLETVEPLDLNLVIPDTLPGVHGLDESRWGEFEKEFTEKFSKQFSEFYSKHQEEFEKMMKDLQANNERMMAQRQSLMSQMDAARAQREMERANRYLDRAQREIARIQPRQVEMMRRRQDNMKNLEERMRLRNRALELNMKQMEEHQRHLEKNMKSFERELSNQLILDGYLGKDDVIKDMNWDPDGNITVNGKKIKDADKKKYNELHQKYFRERGRFRHSE